MDQEIPYEQRRNAALPFGYWCIADPDRYPHLIDEHGRRWPSLREYIWCSPVSYTHLTLPTICSV